ncbi:MAG: protein-L-isoaspartate O-methyltransferase [Pseudomonadota bacterium]
MNDFTAERHAMVDCQVRPSDVTNYAIIDSMLWVPRERFVPRSQKPIAYSEAEIRLNDDRTLLPARTFAKMLEQTGVGQDDLVLDLAPGCGYSSAVFSRLCAAVVAIEPDAGLVKAGEDTLAALEIDNVVLTQGDPAEGDAAHGPFDVIFVNGGVETVPAALVEQLKIGGRLVAIFVDGALGQCRVMVRTDAANSTRYAFDAWAAVLPGFEKEKSFAF